MKMETKLIVASVQMVSSHIWQDNLATAERLIKKAALSGAKVVVIPEFFILIAESGYACKSLIDEDLGHGPIQQKLSDIAKENNIHLVAGSLLIRSPVINRYYNTCIVYSPNGEMLCHYHKTHLFKFDDGKLRIDESETFIRGSDVVTFSVAGVNFGLSICYDLRFPELFRKIGAVDAFVVPAAFAYFTGKAHWEVLLRARAIENQCYVIGSNQGGIHSCGRHTFGHSMIIGPWGDIIDCVASGEGIALGEINLDEIKRVRNSLPALEHRKF